jgi:LasA protease
MRLDFGVECHPGNQMRPHRLRPNMGMILLAFVIIFGVLLACARAFQGSNPNYWSASETGTTPAAVPPSGKQAVLLFPTPGGPILTPTPDAPRKLPPLRSKTDYYVVQPGDTLAQIGQKYGISVGQLVEANQIANPDLVAVGQSLTIPAPTPKAPGPGFKIIPDSELVYGPASAGFDIAAYVQSKGGYLASYYEEVDGVSTSGAQIVQRVAQDYSVNPRLLLAVLEYQGGWMTQAEPKQKAQNYPAGLIDPNHKGLYLQLAWAADNLNHGFYLWRVNGVGAWLLGDGSVVPIDPTINAGTAGVQNFFANLDDYGTWLKDVSASGLISTYSKLFGYPFHYAIEPLLPPNLTQPLMQLPFEPGNVWAFTGGPHGGWAEGSAWAALDFAPPGDAVGCVQSDAWVVAVADGVIVRASNGAVVQDLDGDGYEQTGWSVLYMHIETRDRVQPGTHLLAGEHIGHPSCEGGVSTGTHVHLARRYNGEWIPADQSIPFNLDGWISSGDGTEYDGYLTRNDVSIEAYAGRSPNNGIER